MTIEKMNEILPTVLQRLSDESSEPNNSEIQLTKEEVKEKRSYYWKQIEQAEGFDNYKQAWDKYDYYTNLTK